MPRHAAVRTPRLLGAAVLVLATACARPAEKVGAAASADAATPAAGAPATAAPTAAAPAEAELVTVYKTPSCGCCKAWVEHMRQAGYRMDVHDMDDVQPVKTAMGVPGQLASCHTARVGGYAIEGHVPADVVAQLLREHPADVVGLAVPGMPAGSPGMEGMGKDAYDVIAFTRDGHTRVYASR
ncbi:MAG TPA: DUF411 domain-containing protein [Longimicrobiaceae bacterium]|nr:DUF411 domain-containing protein [Longimicrobiaceae bacterium]